MFEFIEKFLMDNIYDMFLGLCWLDIDKCWDFLYFGLIGIFVFDFVKNDLLSCVVFGEYSFEDGIDGFFGLIWN